MAFLGRRSRAPRIARAVRTLFCVAFGLLLTDSPNAYGQSAPSREYQVKAAFLFNFTQFVDWPPAAFPEDTASLVIGVLGDDPFGPYLDDIVRGELVNSRRLTVRRFRRPEDIAACQVLFISRSQDKNLQKVLSQVKGNDVLTVSDADAFAARGGMIQLATENGKIRLKINVDAARASSLTISSKLLRSAEIVASRDD